MSFIAVKCPQCGADIQFDDSREFGFCNYCGSKVVQDKVVVEHRGTINVNYVNNDFETKFANAKNMEKLYYASPEKVRYGNLYGYDAVVKYYEVAEQAGGSAEGRYWKALANFYVDANLKRFQVHDLLDFLVNRTYINNVDQFITTYKLYIDNAIEYTSDQEEIQKIIEEKEKTILLLEKELPAIQKKAQKIWIIFGLTITGLFILICVGITFFL